jgi:SAM-dependent methyltransferase
MPDAERIPSFYPKAYWWTDRQQSWLSRALTRLERAYREFIALDHVRFLRSCAPPGRGKTTLLDIGCGSGTFLHLARKYGYECFGMDISGQAVAEAQRQYGLDVRQGGIGSGIWADRRFDCISMFHVLEHLPDPGAALEYAGSLLKPGGHLILQVPNAASVQARLFGTRWYGLDVPRHLVNFTPGALSFLLEKSGFQPRVLRRFSLRDNPAALASSLAMRMDPIGRRGRGNRNSALAAALVEFGYFGLVVVSLLPAWLETMVGRGATVWAHASRSNGSSAPQK